MRALNVHLLPLGFNLPQKDRQVVGGYFVWLALPPDLSATLLATRCRDEGVIVAPGPIFEVPSDRVVEFDGHIRLCFAWEEEAKLEVGVRRVADVVRRIMDGQDAVREGYVVVEKESRTPDVDAFK